ncbi:MAG: bifunctional MaoC family dehydratase N-terminal/OB-fold nucleic acid binding domain-containing protein [Myxococcota bacterium]|nr:bifunctional MaoC family dehydratase N-terminal/OB-fold nucleic acid binding domain-containing protein [Myxococcota bacterium]
MTLTAKEKAALEERLQAYVGTEAGPEEIGLDLVNEPMIRHWCEMMGDENPVYTDPEVAKQSVHGGIVAPPTMLQAWILGGRRMTEPPDLSVNRQRALHALLEEHGYESVVATNCEQGYTRYLKPGDQVRARTVFESVSEEKATALGIGYFINTRTTFSDQNGDELGWMTFRVLKFRPNQPQPSAGDAPAATPAKPTRLKPPLGHDNKWWWDALMADQLRIQQCSDCGALRHPPRAMCPQCQSLEWNSVEAAGGGTVYSFTVLHHPPVPGYEYPLPVGLIELDEGTRLVANVVGCDPSEIHIGMRVRAVVEPVDDDLKLPFFYPA